MDKFKLLDDLTVIFKSIFSKLVLPTSKADPLNCTIDDYRNPRPYLGYLFESMSVDSYLRLHYAKRKNTIETTMRKVSYIPLQTVKTMIS